MHEEKKETSSIRELHWNAVRELLPFISACPQIIKPGLGIEAFVDDLKKATEKYALYFGIPNK